MWMLGKVGYFDQQLQTVQFPLDTEGLPQNFRAYTMAHKLERHWYSVRLYVRYQQQKQEVVQLQLRIRRHTSKASHYVHARA